MPINVLLPAFLPKSGYWKQYVFRGVLQTSIVKHLRWKAVNYYLKKFCLRHLTGLWIRQRYFRQRIGSSGWKSFCKGQGFFHYIICVIIYPANIYLFKFRTRKRCEISSKLKVKTLEWFHQRRMFHTFF